MAKSLSDLRILPRTQLKAMNKDALIDSILASADDAIIQTVNEKMNAVKKEMEELKLALLSPESTINRKVNELQDQVNKQAEIIEKQQRFLEGLDRKERECNLVVLGVPEVHESLDGATSDMDKVKKIWEKTGATNDVTSARRLGREGAARDPLRKRPILVTVASREDRDAVLDKAKNLKQSSDVYQLIYVKKDVHPSIREEWRRLREAEKREKERPENVGCNIVFNARERQLYKDGVVIDKWSVQGF